MTDYIEKGGHQRVEATYFIYTLLIPHMCGFLQLRGVNHELPNQVGIQWTSSLACLPFLSEPLAFRCRGRGVAGVEALAV